MNLLIYSALLVLIAVLVLTNIILVNNRNTLKSKFSLLQVIVDPTTTPWALTDKITKTPFEIINSGYICDKVLAYLRKVMTEAYVDTIGGYIYRLKMADIDQQKKDWLILVMKSAVLETSPDLLAKVVVDSLYKEYVDKVGNDSKCMQAAREFIIPLVLSKGNGSGLVSLFRQDFDKGISSLLKGEETKPDERVLIEAESIKFHKLCGR